MISVENFYWAIYENLLKPCDIECRYFFPFGTLEHVSDHEYNRQMSASRVERRYSIFLDQEPLYQSNCNRIDELILRDNWFKTFKILANSEISELKKDYCESRSIFDWHFFYHGFACLDWFRDSRYITEQNEIQNCFLNLNHLFKNKRSYRLGLVARLIASGCHHAGSISLHATKDDLLSELSNPYTELSETSKKLIMDYLFDLELPMALDTKTVNSDFSARLGYSEYQLWQSSLFHVVTETVFYDKKLHLTEKIFKPIVAERPFILVAAPGNLAYFRKYGFRTFGQWVDESYDMIEDNDARLDHISREICRLSNMSLTDLRRMHQEMQEVLAFNKQHFFGNFRKIIVDEMIDNFEMCVRQWNNGRVNYRCPEHPDLQQVKELFYQ